MVLLSTIINNQKLIASPRRKINNKQVAAKMEKQQGQLGYLQLNEDGAVVSSAGDLQNDEKTANIIMSLLTLCQHNDLFVGSQEDHFKRLTLTYDTHSYIVCLSNRKIHIVKKHYEVHPAQSQVSENSL